MFSSFSNTPDCTESTIISLSLESTDDTFTSFWSVQLEGNIRDCDPLEARYDTSKLKENDMLKSSQMSQLLPMQHIHISADAHHIHSRTPLFLYYIHTQKSLISFHFVHPTDLHWSVFFFFVSCHCSSFFMCACWSELSLLSLRHDGGGQGFIPESTGVLTMSLLVLCG